MKAEDNFVDSWLKESVKREMLFRVGAWSTFTVLVFYISFNNPSFALKNYAIPLIHNELDKLNFVWEFLLYVVLLAFFLKEIKHSKPDRWDGETFFSKMGMIVRKITCELLLWVGGLSVSLLLVLSVSLPALLISESDATLKDFFLTLYSIFCIGLLTYITLNIYYFLRRDKPLIFNRVTSHAGIKFIYTSAFIALFMFL
ncbi:hypothetical protein ACERI6_07965 [Citrobacter portucalensis]|uniref:hypothetical protein n=1 Tax=Citrobacter portucalensis TaxID=1639133 RepID=UPI00359CD67A